MIDKTEDVISGTLFIGAPSWRVSEYCNGA